jgi:hypothetical protein
MRCLPDVMTAFDVQRLLDAGGQSHRLWILLAADAGLRISEILSVCPASVLRGIPTLLHVRGKGARVRRVPVTSRLLTALDGADFQRAHRGVAADLAYFQVSTRTLQRWFRSVALVAGVYLPGRRPHSLRHSYASRLCEAGVPLHVVRDLLGHSSLSTTSIYLHSSPGAAAKAARDLELADSAAALLASADPFILVSPFGQKATLVKPRAAGSRRSRARRARRAARIGRKIKALAKVLRTTRKPAKQQDLFRAARFRHRGGI